MKTVVVFDTEDEKGMQATFKIVDHLAKEYLDKNIAKQKCLAVGKIRFIKILRDYGKMVEAGESNNGIADVKDYTNKVWESYVDTKHSK